MGPQARRYVWLTRSTSLNWEGAGGQPAANAKPASVCETATLKTRRARPFTWQGLPGKTHKEYTIMSPEKPDPKRFIGMDIHKHYLIAIGVDEQLNQVLGPQRVQMVNLEG
jgi:hypothetical protein